MINGFLTLIEMDGDDRRTVYVNACDISAFGDYDLNPKYTYISLRNGKSVVVVGTPEDLVKQMIGLLDQPSRKTYSDGLKKGREETLQEVRRILAIDPDYYGWNMGRFS